MAARNASFALVVVLLLATAPAHAATITHAASGFRVDLSAAGVPVCLVTPAAQREPETCEGIDLEQIHAPANTVAFGIGRLENAGMSITLMAFPTSEALTLESARGFTDGFLGGFTSSQPGARLRAFRSGTNFETSIVRGVRVLHYVIVSATGAEGLQMVTHSWTWDADGNYVTLTLAGAAADEAPVVAVGTALVAAATVRPRPGSAVWERGGMTSFQLGQIVGEVIGALAIIIMVVRFARQKRA